MTAKRYYLHKHLIRNDEIHDKICHRWLKGKDLEEDMNTLYSKYSYLKKENEQLKQQNKGIQDKVWKLLELLEKEKGIDKRKIIDWWNGDVE